MAEYLKLSSLVGSIVYSILGLVVMIGAFIAVDKLTPYDLWRELVEQRNQALATVVAAFTLAIAIIVAAAIH